MTTRRNYELMTVILHVVSCNQREKMRETGMKEESQMITLTESALFFNHSIWTLETRVKQEEKKGKDREKKKMKCKLDLNQRTKEICFRLKRTLFQYTSRVFLSAVRCT